MSDVIWAGAIAGGVGLAGNVVTYLVSKGQRRVELAKVNAEYDRLRQEHREAERSNRQGTYHRTLAVLDRLDMFATGYNPESETEYMVALEELNTLVGGIHLFGAQSVRDALGPVAEEFARLGERIGIQQWAGRQSGNQPVPYAVAYGEAYRDRRNEIIAATAALTEAMRADVTRDILEDPPVE